MKAGVKCDADCSPENWLLEIRNDDGETLAVNEVSVEPWPETQALFFADFELTAPDTEGLFNWQVVAPAIDQRTDKAGADGPVHDEAVHSFNLRTVPEADCRLTVVAIERETQAPVQGLNVVAHPYRTTTDEQGVAELKLPKGQVRLFVTGKNFFPFRVDCDVSDDQTIRAELVIDEGPSDAELWS